MALGPQRVSWPWIPPKTGSQPSVTAETPILIRPTRCHGKLSRNPDMTVYIPYIWMGQSDCRDGVSYSYNDDCIKDVATQLAKAAKRLNQYFKLIGVEPK